MGRYTKLLSILSFAVMVMGLSIVASAQWRNGRGNNGSYDNTTYNRNLNSTIRNLRDKSRRFEDILDRELDRSRYDGSRREDQLNKLAERFKNAAENLDDEYDNGRDFYRSRDEAQRVLSLGSQLDRALSSARLGKNSGLMSYWNSIERDLRTISREYNSSYNNNRNTRNNRNGTYNRNQRGTYDRRNTRNLRSTIVNLKHNSRHFEDRLDREDNNRYGRRNLGGLERLSDRFYDAVKDLEDEYDSNRDYNRSYDEVRRVLSLGGQIDREISRTRVSRSIRNDWNRIERDLRTLAKAYNSRYSGTTYRKTRLSDIFRNFPF